MRRRDAVAALRAPGPPEDVRERAGLGRREKVLAWAQADDTALLGTREVLLVVPEGTGGEPRRIPWEDVERAGWDSEERVLTVTEVGQWGESRPEHRFGFEDPSGPVRLLQLLRERVTASIVLQRRVLVTGKRGFTVHGRRPPSGGDVVWSVEYDAGVDPADPEVRTAAGAAVDAARSEI